MEDLIAFRETLLEYQDPANGKRDMKRKNGADGPGPLTIEARRELPDSSTQVAGDNGFKLISDDELFLIQQLWKSARRPDDGGGVARIVTRQKGIIMSDWKDANRLRELQEEIAAEKDIRPDTLRRLLAKVDEFSESHRAFGLPDDLRASSKTTWSTRNQRRKIRVSEVYIDSLTVRNFGPYYGEHTFNFTTHDDRCGILIGGKNGAGKTHLLRALYLAVTGETGVHDLKKVEPVAEATRFAFEMSLNRRAESEGEDTALLQVTISQRDDKGTRKALIVREIRHRPNSGPVWHSYADRLDGSARIEDDKHLEALRDALLPRHLARFFFFDAERGQDSNLGQQEIVEGISRILGLWSYRELESDLRQLIQNKIPRAFNSSEGHEAARKLAQVTNYGVRFVFFDMKGELEDDPNNPEQQKIRSKFLEQTGARSVRLIQQDLPIRTYHLRSHVSGGGSISKGKLGRHPPLCSLWSQR